MFHQLNKNGDEGEDEKEEETIHHVNSEHVTTKWKLTSKFEGRKSVSILLKTDYIRRTLPSLT